MEKMSEETYLLNCEKIEQHNALYKKYVFTYAKGKNHLMYQNFEDVESSLCGTQLPQRSRALEASTVFRTYPEPSKVYSFAKKFLDKLRFETYFSWS
jgi:hypothetical protein